MKKYFLFFISCMLIQEASALVEVTSPTGLLVSTGDPSTAIASLIAGGIGIAAILGVISLTWAGIQMILAAGDDEKIKKAKQMILYSIVGVVLAGLAYGIVKVISILQF